MRYGRFLWLVAPLMAVAACSDDDGITHQPPPGPAALVRFINAVPDLPSADLRFVDKVENLPTMQGVPFRGGSGMYQRVEPGTRATRVFPTSSNVDSAKIRLIDTQLTLNAQARYTLLFAGRVADNSHALHVLDDPAQINRAPDGQISIQLLHAAVGTNQVDVYVVPVDSVNAPTPADWSTNYVTKFSNVGYLERVAYTNMATAASNKLYRFVVTAAGSATPLFSGTPNLPGQAAPAGATYGPQPGVRIGGSVLTAVIFGGASPTVGLFPDKALDPQ